MLDNPFCEENFPNTWFKPFLVQTEVISFCPITWKQINSHFSAACFFRLLWREARSPLSLLSSWLKTPAPSAAPHEACAPDPQCSSTSVLEPSCCEGPRIRHSPQDVLSPVPSTGRQSLPWSCWPHHWWHRPSATGFLGHLGTLLAHVQWLSMNPEAPDPFCWALSRHCMELVWHTGRTHHLTLWTLTSVHPLTFGTSCPDTSAEPTYPPAGQLLPSLVSSANSLRSHLIALSSLLIEMLCNAGPSSESCGTPLVIGHQLDITPFSKIFWAIHPVLYQEERTSLSVMSCHDPSPRLCCC